MIVNVLSIAILVALVVLFAWLARRAWGSKRRILKWPGLFSAGLLTILLAIATALFAKGMLQVYGTRPVAAVSVNIARTPEQVARGEHIASVLCATCHSTDGTLPLSGGNDLFKEAALPLGSMCAPNLTPGGRLQQLSDGDLVRILRTGVEPTGRWTIMGSFPARYLSDQDMQAVIAYLRTAPASRRQTPPPDYAPLFVFFAGAGVLPLGVPGTIQAVSAPPKAPTSQYGEYIKNIMDCRGCHGPTLSADGGFFSPRSAPNLTLIVPRWSKDEFFQAMRTGVDLTGHRIRPPMPWKQIGKLDDVELEALYQYLHGLTPITRTSK